MGIPIRRGRVFTSRDTADQPSVVVINETLAKQFFGARDPVGHRLKVQGAWRTIVGVVSDVKSASLESDIRAQVYRPHAQDPWPPMTVVLHIEGNPLALTSAVRGEVKALDGHATMHCMNSSSKSRSSGSGILVTLWAATNRRRIQSPHKTSVARFECAAGQAG